MPRGTGVALITSSLSAQLGTQPTLAAKAERFGAKRCVRLSVLQCGKGIIGALHLIAWCTVRPAVSQRANKSTSGAVALSCVRHQRCIDASALQHDDDASTERFCSLFNGPLGRVLGRDFMRSC